MGTEFVSFPSKSLEQCCDCGCSCSLTVSSSSNGAWIRSVKRKYAANETMSMILRLQREKAEVQMEARQFKRFSEEKMSHDAQEISAWEGECIQTQEKRVK